MLNLEACFAILNLSPHASAHEVRQAYLTLVKQWHPDRHAPHHQHQVAEKFRQVTEAYQYLKQHLESIETPAKVQESSNFLVQPLMASELYEAAVILAEQRQYVEAIAQLSLAIRIEPEFVEAYRFRGHLNSLLGFEHRAAADFAKTSSPAPASSTMPDQSPSLEQEFTQVKEQALTRQTQYKLRIGAIVASLFAAVAIGYTIRSSMDKVPPLEPVVFESQSR